MCPSLHGLRCEWNLRTDGKAPSPLACTVVEESSAPTANKRGMRLDLFHTACLWVAAVACALAVVEGVQENSTVENGGWVFHGTGGCSVNGEQGKDMTSSRHDRKGAGGGAGGTILVEAGRLLSSSGTLSANGGRDVVVARRANLRRHGTCNLRTIPPAALDDRSFPLPLSSTSARPAARNWPAGG